MSEAGPSFAELLAAAGQAKGQALLAALGVRLDGMPEPKEAEPDTEPEAADVFAITSPLGSKPTHEWLRALHPPRPEAEQPPDD